MKFGYGIFLTIMLSLIMLTPALLGQSSAPANSTSGSPGPSDDGFHMDVTPYLWFAGMHGTSGIGGHDASVLRVYGKEQEASRSATQQREQSFNQDKSSGGWSTQNLNSEMQSRQSGAAQSDHYQNYQHSGGGWGGSHSFGGWGGGGRSWGGGGDRSWGGGGWRR